MIRARALAAGLLALASGAVVLGVVSTIDKTYQAEASVLLRPVVGDDDLQGVIRLRQHDFRLATSSNAPFLPEGERALRRIAAAAGVPRDDIELVDTDSLALFPDFRKPVRRLKVLVPGPDPDRAARAANSVLRGYVAYRGRWYARELGQVRRYLARKVRRRRSGRLAFPSGPEHPEEGAAAASLLLQLERGTFGLVRPAAAAAEPIAPRTTRDVLVAALTGGLLAWSLAPAVLRIARRPRA